MGAQVVVQRIIPHFRMSARDCDVHWQCPVGRSWRIDETYSPSHKGFVPVVV